MTITTKNTNPKNDSHWARHRSITKGNQNQLDDVVNALKAQQGVKYVQVDRAPMQLREEWRKKLDTGILGFTGLPGFNAHPANLAGTAGLAEWLGPSNLFLADLGTIYTDFAKIFIRRAHDDDKTIQRLFVSCTTTNFDLIYSKWGTTPGHKFFHWAAIVGTAPSSRATIDDFADADDQGDENAM